MSDRATRRWPGIGRGLFGTLFILGGIGHFVAPEFYLKIMPPYLPLPAALVFASGVCEFTLGILLLVPKTSRFAAWGLIALLIAVFPANVFMYQHADEFEISASLLLLRLPLQGLLILWAYSYTKGTAASARGGT